MKYIATLIFLLSLLSCTKTSTNCTYLITCTEKIEDGGASIPLTDVVGFVFYADSSVYTPKSYEEALSGTISDKLGTVTINADVKSLFDPKESLITMPNLSKAGKSVFVICDIKNKIYSFRQYTIEQNLPEIITTLETYPYQFELNPNDVINVTGWIQKR